MSRRSFNPRRITGWRGFWLWFAVGVSFGLVLWTLGVDRSDAAEPRSQRAFVKAFDRGDYGRQREKVRYADGFRADYVEAARKSWDRRERRRDRRAESDGRDYERRPFRPARHWNRFTARDTCRSVLVNTPDCTYRFPRLGPAYEKRWETQEKWTVRVVFCGITGYAMLVTGGTAAQALGFGSGLCFAGLFVD